MRLKLDNSYLLGFELCTDTLSPPVVSVCLLSSAFRVIFLQKNSLIRTVGSFSLCGGPERAQKGRFASPEGSLPVKSGLLLGCALHLLAVILEK